MKEVAALIDSFDGSSTQTLCFLSASCPENFLGPKLYNIVDGKTNAVVYRGILIMYCPERNVVKAVRYDEYDDLCSELSDVKEPFELSERKELWASPAPESTDRARAPHLALLANGQVLVFFPLLPVGQDAAAAAAADLDGGFYYYNNPRVCSIVGISPVTGARVFEVSRELVSLEGAGVVLYEDGFGYYRTSLRAQDFVFCDFSGERSLDRHWAPNLVNSKRFSVRYMTGSDDLQVIFSEDDDDQRIHGWVHQPLLGNNNNNINNELRDIACGERLIAFAYPDHVDVCCSRFGTLVMRITDVAPRNVFFSPSEATVWVVNFVIPEGPEGPEGPGEWPGHLFAVHPSRRVLRFSLPETQKFAALFGGLDLNVADVSGEHFYQLLAMAKMFYRGEPEDGVF